MFHYLQPLFFPATYREIPRRRFILNLLRTVHILCFSILLGGVYFNVSQSLLTAWLMGTIISGFGLFLVDLYGSFIALFEIRGVSVLIKIVLLSFFPLLDESNQLVLLFMVIIFSSFVSHSTRRIRHKNLMPAGFIKKYGIRDEK